MGVLNLSGFVYVCAAFGWWRRVGILLGAERWLGLGWRDRMGEGDGTGESGIVESRAE